MLVRSDNEAVVVNLDIEPVEKPEAVYWVDPDPQAPLTGIVVPAWPAGPVVSLIENNPLADMR